MEPEEEKENLGSCVRHFLGEFDIPSLCLSPQEKIELRDVFTSAIPSAALMEWVGLKTPSATSDGFLSALIRCPKDTARVAFDRNIGKNGLLYFLHLWEDSERSSQIPIWLLLRLVTLKKEEKELHLAEREQKEQKEQKEQEPVTDRVLEVHDWKCKECMYGKECGFEFKAIDCVDGRTMALNVQVNFDPEVDVYLYATILNAQGDPGTLSFPFQALPPTKSGLKIATPKKKSASSPMRSASPRSFIKMSRNRAKHKDKSGEEEEEGIGGKSKEKEEKGKEIEKDRREGFKKTKGEGRWYGGSPKSSGPSPRATKKSGNVNESPPLTFPPEGKVPSIAFPPPTEGRTARTSPRRQSPTVGGRRGKAE